MRASTRFVFAVGFVSSLLCSTIANAGSCKGDGCQHIEIQKRGGCIVLHNNHNKPIKVLSKANFVTGGVIYANSDFIPKWGMPPVECLKGYDSDYTAVIQK